MRAILFGATGMIGQGVLRELLLDPKVTHVTAIGRAPVAQQHEKPSNLVHANLNDFSPIASQLAGFDACFYCLGVSSAGMSEEAYTKVTYDLTVSAAKAVLQASPGITFLFISGASTDSTEKKGPMWARVKGRAENALLAMGFKAAYMFRPGLIRPLHGITSRTALYRAVYVILWPFMPLLIALGAGTTTENLGRAMINVAMKGFGKKILEGKDINEAARG